jgi:methylmalonyl-CoA mutase cobalamin-binding subunit
MTLSASNLKTAIQAIGNKTTIAAAAEAWASAVGAYASDLIPVSGAVAGAQTTLQAELATAFAERPSAASKMDDAFDAFALTVAGGMTTHTGAPPAGTVGFAAVFSPTEDAADAAEDIADAIHAWMITGEATLKASPFTVSAWA